MTFGQAIPVLCHGNLLIHKMLQIINLHLCPYIRFSLLTFVLVPETFCGYLLAFCEEIFKRKTFSSAPGKVMFYMVLWLQIRKVKSAEVHYINYITKLLRALSLTICPHVTLH